MPDTYLIHGQEPDSQNEANVAQALERLGFNYVYQYKVGPMGVRGSQVIDFLVYTIPLPTPLFVHGRYWHSGEIGAEDEMKMMRLKAQMRGKWADPVIIWGEDSETVEDAIETLRKVLM